MEALQQKPQLSPIQNSHAGSKGLETLPELIFRHLNSRPAACCWITSRKKTSSLRFWKLSEPAFLCVASSCFGGRSVCKAKKHKVSKRCEADTRCQTVVYTGSFLRSWSALFISPSASVRQSKRCLYSQRLSSRGGVRNRWEAKSCFITSILRPLYVCLNYVENTPKSREFTADSLKFMIYCFNVLWLQVKLPWLSQNNEDWLAIQHHFYLASCFHYRLNELRWKTIWMSLRPRIQQHTSWKRCQSFLPSIHVDVFRQNLRNPLKVLLRYRVHETRTHWWTDGRPVT